MTFSFGQNWSQYVQQHLSEERMRVAREHLLRFLGVPSLKGLTFLDIGSGSGLHSLGAFDAGASRVVSFDLDPQSVASTQHLRSLRGDPANWTVMQGSILDKDFLRTIEPADVVYSWGVLHHTGSMWQAIENAAGFMHDQSVFYVALYTKTKFSDFWKRIKLKYNRASEFEKKRMVMSYYFHDAVLPWLKKPWRAPSPWKRVRDHRKSRGMEYFTDVRDWLGGWPYEDATVNEVMDFSLDRLSLGLLKLRTGEACTEYLLARWPQVKDCVLKRVQG